MHMLLTSDTRAHEACLLMRAHTAKQASMTQPSQRLAYLFLDLRTSAAIASGVAAPSASL